MGRSAASGRAHWVSGKTRLHFSAEQIAATLADYLRFLRLVQIPQHSARGVVRPEGQHGPQCAVRARAHYIVSGDKDLLVLQEFRGVQIVRASDFWKSWMTRNADRDRAQRLSIKCLICRSTAPIDSAEVWSQVHHLDEVKKHLSLSP